MGRATSIGAYVKRGEESGYVKITLKGESKGEKISIMRKIDIHNKSEWVLNGISPFNLTEFFSLSESVFSFSLRKLLKGPLTVGFS